MKVSAVGFLFQDKIKGKRPIRGKNYTCTIHKVNIDGNYNRNLISSPIVKTEKQDIVSPQTAKADILASLLKIDSKETTSKFKGATIKDGIKETEIHSLFSDKLFAVRTRDEFGKNHFAVKGKKSTKNLLAHNLYINV